MNEIFTGDALTVLRGLPDASVQMCVTSPPYFGLRDYGVTGQIGLETSPDAYIAALVEVFREVKRTLRDDGTLWLNIGDSYTGSGKGTRGKQEYLKSNIPHNAAYVPDGMKPKNLMMIPARVALALQEDGWYLRSDIIWHKINAMPESVTDRPTSSHEHIFLLAKSERYYYDADAIKEKAIKGSANAGARNYLAIADGAKRYRLGQTEQEASAGRNKRDVWTVASHAYSEAHFATFPPKLIEPCILAGSSPKACEHCAAQWQRVTEPTGHINKREPAHVPNNCATKTDSTGWAHTRRGTNEWRPTCSCENEGTGKCIVLDPFCGAGTTPLVAIQHHRQYIGIELNPTYVALAMKRIAVVQPNMWSEVSA